MTATLRSPDRLNTFDGSSWSPKALHWGAPDDWLAAHPWPTRFAVHGFDFFADVKSATITHDELWVKRIADAGHVSTAASLRVNPDGLPLVAAPEAPDWSALAGAVAPFGLTVGLVVVPDLPTAAAWEGYDRHREAVLHATIDPDGVPRQRTWWSLNELQRQIVARRGRPFRIGPKGLFVATSALEKWLSVAKSGAMWPGDCDGLLCRDGVPVAVIEWKKHTMPTPLDDSLFATYAKTDAAKWNALVALSQRLGELPVVLVSWPTRAEHTEAAVQVVSGAPGRLEGSAPTWVSMRAPNLAAEMLEAIRTVTDV